MWELLAIFDDKITVSTTLKEWYLLHGFNILVIIVGAWLLQHIGSLVVKQVIHRTVRHDLYPTVDDRKKRIKTLDGLISAVIHISVWAIAFIMIIDELGVNTSPLLASVGVVGIALGFGAQSLIKDFVSGLFIIIENQYRLGDIVELDNVSGVVEAITLRTTVLRDLNGDLHHVPNGAITVTTNKTIDYGSINEDIIVSRKTNIEQLEHIINHIGSELAAMPEFKHKITEPPHFERIKGFMNDGIEIKVLGKTTTDSKWAVKSEFYLRLQKAFEKNGIETEAHGLLAHTKTKSKK